MSAPYSSDDSSSAMERTSLLSAPPTSPPAFSAFTASALYLSHFLSTWNSRVFEFGAVLYLARIYPNTLLPMSAYAFARGLSAIIFAPAVGGYIDTGDRLQVVRVSIVSQRISVAISCWIFYLLIQNRLPATNGGLLVLSILACAEKLGSILNLVSVEKDWVVVVAQGDSNLLGRLNAQMRRIDLLCKLIGPLSIALIDGYSTRTAILCNLGVNLASVVIEYYAIARVYLHCLDLQVPKIHPMPSSETTGSNTCLKNHWRHVQTYFHKSINDFRRYFRHPAFLASFSGALLYLTVLSFAGQMVSFLLAVDYTSAQIGGARTLSVAFEVLATWVAPWLITRIGTIRAGLWMSTWQVTMLISGVGVFCLCEKKPTLAATGLVVGTILSRVGLRGFDLCTQLIVQEEVAGDDRGAFSSVEAAWQNAFELLSFSSTMIWSRPEQFKWPALLSTFAVTCASCAYTLFVFLRRGHLIHFAKLPIGRSKPNEIDDRQRVVERITDQRDI